MFANAHISSLGYLWFQKRKPSVILCRWGWGSVDRESQRFELHMQHVACSSFNDRGFTKKTDWNLAYGLRFVVL